MENQKVMILRMRKERKEFRDYIGVRFTFPRAVDKIIGEIGVFIEDW